MLVCMHLPCLAAVFQTIWLPVRHSIESLGDLTKVKV